MGKITPIPFEDDNTGPDWLSGGITPNLEIKLNNCATNDPCALCTRHTNSNVGPELFLAGTWAIVCSECGARYAPDLMRSLDYLQASPETWADLEAHPIGAREIPDEVGALFDAWSAGQPQRDELLAEYASKPVRRFFQIDGWTMPNGGDSLFTPDEDGCVLSGGHVQELRTSDWPVRVYINPTADQAEVLLLLRKAAEWVERDWEIMTETPHPDEDDEPSE